MLEFQQFNAMWDRKTSEYEERAAELLEAMRQRHALDQLELRKKSASEPASDDVSDASTSSGIESSSSLTTRGLAAPWQRFANSDGND